MRIIIFNDRPDYKGGTLYYQRLKQILLEHGVQVTIKTAMPTFSIIFRFDLLIMKYLGVSLISYLRCFYCLLKGYNVIYGSNVFIPKLLRKITKLKIVAWFPDFQMHDLPHMFTAYQIKSRKRFEAILLSYCDSIVVQNAHDRKRMKQISDCEKIHVIKFYQPRVAPLSVNSDRLTNKPYILVAAQGWRHKRLDCILRAYDRSTKKYDLIIIGSPFDPRDPEYSENLRYNLTKNTACYLGFVSQEEKQMLMVGAAGLLNYSLYEGWNSSIEEAISFELPVILSDIPIHREQLPEALFVKDEEQLSSVFSGKLPVEKRYVYENVYARRRETIESFVSNL